MSERPFSHLVNVRIYLKNDSDGDTTVSTSVTTLKNRLTGRFAGKVVTKFVSDHNASVDQVPPPGVEEGVVLSKENPVKSATATKKKSGSGLTPPQDVGIPDWQREDLKD